MQASHTAARADFRLWIAITLLATVLLPVRLNSFSQTEPRHDQGYFASTVRDLLAADHVLPRRTPGQSFSAALQSDQKSVMHTIGRPLYANPLFALLLVPFFAWSLLLAPFGYSYQHLTELSIITSVFNLLPLTLLFRRVTGFSGLAAAAAAGAYATSAYVGLFSAWGYHNLALNTFLWAALAGSSLSLAPAATSEKALWAGLVRNLWPLIVLTLAATYSQQINVLLVPAAITLYILVFPGVPLSLRIKAAALYAAAVLAGLAPVGLFATALHRVQHDFTSYANTGSSIGGYLLGTGSRAGAWFLCGRQMFSLPGTLAGIAGVVYLALRKSRLPLAFLAVHFLGYCLIPGLTWAGGHTYLRTWNYVIPILSIGIGFLLVELFGNAARLRQQAAVAVVFTLAVAAHLSAQWPSNGMNSWVEDRLGDFVSTYLIGQGELRPAIAKLETQVNGAPLLFWGLPEKYAYVSLAHNADNVGLSVLTSDGMYSRNTRPTTFGPDGTRLEYMIASKEADSGDPFSEEALKSALRRLYHVEPEVRYLGEYPLSSAWCRTLVLYSAKIAKAP